MSQAGAGVVASSWEGAPARRPSFAALRTVLTWLLLAVVVLLVVSPIAAILYGAFRTRVPGDPRAVFTFQKIAVAYGGLVTGSWTQSATFHTILLAVPVTIVSTSLGLLLAWAVMRTDMPGKRTMEMAFLLPLLYSPLVGVIGWTVLADPRAGLVNQLWSGIVGHNAALIDVYSYAGIAWVMVFYFAPYAFLLSSGGFRALDVTLEEAAAISGAGLLKRMAFVTLPVMLPGIAAAFICVVLGLVLGYRVTRAKSLAVAAIDYMIALPIGIPGTVFGVGMLWAYLRRPIYLTLWILLLAFVIRYLVYSVRTIGGALMQIDPVLEESAAVAGRSPLRSFLFVYLPLLQPVIASAWLLVFLIVMREISSSITLYGTNTVTLPILTWSYLNDGSYGVASALAIVQIVIVGAVVVLARALFGADIRSRSAE